MEEGTGRAARPSRKLLKYALYGFAVVALAIGGAIFYLLATFDPLDHRERIVDFVRDKTGRTLEIKGDVALSFWPDLGVRLGALSLSERGSDEAFASIESARLRLELEPLLSRELVASEVVLIGANVRIVRYEDERLNIDDLLQGEGGTPQFDIGRARVERSSITYHDLATQAAYVLGDIALETGRLTSGVKTPISLAMSARDAKDSFALRTALRGRMTLDLPQKRYALEQASLEVDGRVPGMDDLAARASGSASFEREGSKLDVSALIATLGGTYAHDVLKVALDAASLRFVPGEAAGESLRMSVVAEGAAGKTDIKLASDALTRLQDRIASDALGVEVALERGGHRVRAAIATTLEAAIAARKLTFSEMTADFNATGPRLPGKGVAGAVKGEARLDLAQQGIRVQLAGKVADSNVKARVSAAGFASPVYSFALDVDELDLDRYIVADPRGRKKAPQAPASANHLLAPLADLPATGTLSVGVLTVADTRARDVRLTLE